MAGLEQSIDEVAAAVSFTGVVRVDRGGDTVLAKAYGFANRALEVPNTIDTRFALASGGKGFTALAVVSLIEDGVLSLDTTARSILGSDLPLIDDRVTIEHLLAHRSGIGDYIDEDDEDGEITDYILRRPPNEYLGIEAFVPELDGHPTKFAPDTDFSYCNSGFMVLGLIAERASGTDFHELIAERVCVPAELFDTDYLRSDELPGDAALGCLAREESLRTNIFHLPVLGSGDGGIYSTAEDMHAFWDALFEGEIVPTDWVAKMTTPTSAVPAQDKRYGLGFWLHESTDAVILLGYDAGVSFQSARDPRSEVTFTMMSNTSDGPWPVARRLGELLLDQEIGAASVNR
jgi:CubicO group peptidase (beta-lactamase class C family)